MNDFIIITRLGGTLINTDKCVGKEFNDWTSNEHLRFLGASGDTGLGYALHCGPFSRVKGAWALRP